MFLNFLPVYICTWKKLLKIAMGYPESANRRKTQSTMTERKKDKDTIINTTQHRKLNIGHREPHKR